jgi:hypothetical protein
MPMPEMSSLNSKEWKKLSDEQRAEYNEKAAKINESNPSFKKTEEKPMTAYSFFTKDYRGK